MRIIKFRAWDERNKIMVFPVCVYEDGHIGFGLSTYEKCYGKEFNPDMGCEPECLGDDWFYLLGGIKIMQFTGLKDRNGKEIYEGDIIHRLKTGGYGSHLVGDVIIDGFKISGDSQDRQYEILGGLDSWLYLKDTKLNRIGWLRFKDITTFEIIGNIYENPQLLEAQKG